MNYRKTYAEVNLNNLNGNLKLINQKLNNYEYKIAAVKADCYGHFGDLPIKCIIDSGINYLAVATLEEALEIRKNFKDIPILCLGIIPLEYINICARKKITVTISNLDYANNIMYYSNLKVHIKVNTGMNRLGVNNSEDLKNIINVLNKKKIFIEGIFTHIYNSDNEKDTLKQISFFEDITKNINFEDFKMVHIGGSGYALNYPKLSYVNGVRFGRAIYGWDIKEYKSTFSLISEVIQINDVENSTVGYNGSYKVNGNEKIAVIPIGYADGINRHMKGFYVYINEKKILYSG